MPNHGTEPKSGLCRERGKRSGLTSTARPQAMCWTRRPAAVAAVVTAAAAFFVASAAHSGVTQRPARRRAAGRPQAPCLCRAPSWSAAILQ